MANTYVITSMVHATGATGDFPWQVSGTVNGTPVSVTVWNSVLSPNLGSAIAFQNFITPLFLAVYNGLTPIPQAPPLTSWSV